MWIIFLLLGVIVFFLLLSLFFFLFSLVRQKEQEPDFQNPADGWHPYAAQMKEAQRWMQQHTASMVEITSYDGLRLQAALIPAENPKGVLILFHGYRSRADVDFVLQLSGYHQQGYTLLVPWQRSHGTSEGKLITYGVKERKDCQKWAEYAAKTFGKELPVFLGGISMGCATVVMSLGLSLPENVVGVIADCGFTSPWEIMAFVAKKRYHLPVFPVLYLVGFFVKLAGGFSLKEADTRKILQNNTIPVLFIHGKEDDFVPLFMTMQNYEACRGEKELFLVEGAAHAVSYAVDPRGYSEKVFAFLEKQRQAYACKGSDKDVGTELQSGSL